jgi:DNA-3-methyladenine glycosylase II
MHEYRARPTPPFSFELTASLLSPGPTDQVDVFDGKRYMRLLELETSSRLALVSSLGSEQRPELIITLMNGTEADERPTGRVLTRMLGLDFDLGPFYELCQCDQQLYALSRDHYGLKPLQRLRPFESLALAIASEGQKKHMLRATLSSIAEVHSYKVACAGETFYSFPNAATFAGLEVEDLTHEPVDSIQAGQLHNLAGLVTRGDLDLKALHRRPTDELLATLESLSGVSAVGAQLTVLCGYGRLECFPIADTLLQRWITRNVYNSDKVDLPAVKAWAEQWEDLRGLVALYIYAELVKNGEL